MIMLFQNTTAAVIGLLWHEIWTSTSSMTSVLKPLKFLRPRYGTVKAHYETLTTSDIKKLLADTLSVLALTMSAEGERESLKYRLLGQHILLVYLQTEASLDAGIFLAQTIS